MTSSSSIKCTPCCHSFISFLYILSIAHVSCSSDKKGGVYYFNTDTGESTWEHPADIYYRNAIKEAKEKKRRTVGGSIILQASHAEPQTRKKKKASLKAGGGKAGGDVLKSRPVLGPISGSSVEVVLRTSVYVVVCRKETE